MSYQIKDQVGAPVIKDGKNLLGSDRLGVVKDVNTDTRTLVIVGTDESKDRDGDVLSVKGWIMENFMKNPVFLYAHDYHSVPIGVATKIVRRKNPDRLEFHEKFPSKGIYPFADMILELFREKILNASSVGFIPIEWESLDKDGDPNGWRGKRFLKQELLELSACPVPSNPSAIQTDAYIKAFNGKNIIEVIAELKSQVKEEDVLNDFVDKVGDYPEFEDETVSIYQVPKNFELEEKDMDEIKEMLKLHLEKLSEIEVKISSLQESINKQTPSPIDNGVSGQKEVALSEEDAKVLKTITESIKEAIKTLNP